MPLLLIAIVFYLGLCGAPWAQSPPPVYCTDTAGVTGTGTGITKIVTGQAGHQIYVCGYQLGASAAVNVNFYSGTGTNCGTDQSPFPVTVSFGAAGALVDHPGTASGTVKLGYDLCWQVSAAGPTVTGTIYYGIFRPR
jgi:hypothetical protein